ncbi:DUF1223 domain-containing protein [Methylibium sp.]|uniref:DUF1223 domain-containing protein n=1 Tax=Methylibium sp. TaxID=2067992 RepID=UPI003D0A3704
MMRKALTTLLLVPCLAVAAEPVCRARSGAVAPLVVELYTSEGCNSCPPADRWLSTLKGRSDVVALAFHVDYWDRLGWTDRFARPEWTRRQSQAGLVSGSSFVYTPQVLVNGRDYRRWPALPDTPSPSLVSLDLSREGADYVVRVTPQAGAPHELAGYWAVTEDNHRTQVRAGENAGALLQHDAVVRELQPVAAVGDAPLHFRPQAEPDRLSGPRPQRVQFVVTAARTGLPLQAVALGC